MTYHTRMRFTNDLDSRVYVTTGPKQGFEGITYQNFGKKGHIARECPQPVKCSHCGKSRHAAKHCWAKDPSKRPGGSSNFLQMKSADMLQSFSNVCRMFHFGSSRLFQHVFDDCESNTVETDILFKTDVETNDETTDSDKYHFAVFVKTIMAHLDSWNGSTMLGGQVQVNLIGNAGVTGLLWTLVLGCCVVFLR